MDAFTGQILDKLDELGIADDTIVVWTSDNGADPHYRFSAIDPDPVGAQWTGFSGPWRCGYFTSLEGANRVPCLVRWTGNVPAGKVSNELVHLVDMFPTLVHAGGGTVPLTARSTAWTGAASSSVTLRNRAATPSCASRATGCKRRSGANGRRTSSSRRTAVPPGHRSTCQVATTSNGTRAKSIRFSSHTDGCSILWRRRLLRS